MKCQVGYNLSNLSHGILTCGSNGLWQGTMGTCNGKNNPPNATQIVQRLHFANLKANLRPQETSLSTFCFLPLRHFFFWSSNFFTFSKSIRCNAYTISLRTGSPFWWKWGLKSRGEGEGKNETGSFRCPPPLLPPFFSLLIFFFPTPLWGLIPG